MGDESCSSLSPPFLTISSPVWSCSYSRAEILLQNTNILRSHFFLLLLFSLFLSAPPTSLLCGKGYNCLEPHSRLLISFPDGIDRGEAEWEESAVSERRKTSLSNDCVCVCKQKVRGARGTKGKSFLPPDAMITMCTKCCSHFSFSPHFHSAISIHTYWIPGSVLVCSEHGMCVCVHQHREQREIDQVA